ncbi:MAG: hypothetical protein HYY24_16335 [Verrucomicrobia bacterium]|nr:hypothetical protein [Verrucomicrobiota bacterium]
MSDEFKFDVFLSHSACKSGIDATKKFPGEGFDPDTRVGALIKMDAAVKAKVGKLAFPRMERTLARS